MKNKTKYLLYTVLFLNIIFISLYTYNRLFNKSNLKIAQISKNDIYDEIYYNNLKEYYYGDIFPNHIINSIDGKIIDISNSNKQYKFIEYNRYLSNTELQLRIEFFNKFNKLQSSLNSNKIFYVFLFENAIVNEKNKKVLEKIQEKYNINLATTSDSLIIRLYNFKSLGCNNYILLLDENNIVRFLNAGVAIETIFKIISKEISNTE